MIDVDPRPDARPDPATQEPAAREPGHAAPAPAPARARTTLAARILWRATAFAIAAFLLLAAGELWLERAAQRSEIHQRAVQVTTLALPSVERAVWAYDAPGLRVLADSLLREDSITRVRVTTPDGSMNIEADRGEPEDRDTVVWSRPLRTPDRREPMGTIEVTESFRQVDLQTLQRATWRLPMELVKVLCIVIGMTLLVRSLVVNRLASLAAQLRAFRPDDMSAEVRDRDQSGVEDEITTLAASLNGFLRDRGELRSAALARERAEAASRAKTEFLSNMSHELRTPLNAIVGFAQALRDDPEVMRDPRRAERVGLIGKAGLHLSRLISDMLDLSRIESGALRVVPQAVDVRVACGDAMALVRNDAAAAGVRLEIDLDDRARHVRADPTRLDQVLLNLLSNGVKYNRPGGRVSLRTRAHGGAEVEIRVEDDGLGMTGEQRAGLFQPFNRLGRQNSGKPGTGIGLVITRRLVELMGGRLDVESHAGAGSVFTLWLPAEPSPPMVADGLGAEALPPPEDRPPPPQQQQPLPLPTADDAGVPPRPLTLADALPPRSAEAHVAHTQGLALYIEDEPVNVEVMRAVLANRPGVRLVAAARIDEGADLLRRLRPGLLLLDIQLPDGDGLAFLGHLRSDPDFATLPVAVVSADALPETLVRARHAGADEVLSKPYDFERLLEVVDRHLSRGVSLADGR